jgi:cell wall-associated NlpC family hydrolase
VPREYHTVVEPVTNLKKVPRERVPSYAKDDLLFSQLLFGEKVLVRDEHNGWALVEAVEQQMFQMHEQWEGYSGWVQKESIKPCGARQTETGATVKTRTALVYSMPDCNSATLFNLSIGTRIDACQTSAEIERFYPVCLAGGGTGWIDKEKLRMTDQEAAWWQDREDVLATALFFMRVPYLWGGRSMHMPDLQATATGVDCSGLVNIVFRVHGIDLPRDAHEQWMKATPVSADNLRPCDLIFVANGENTVTHVMLFVGGESFIEARETGANVTMGTFKERFGKNLAAFCGEGPKIYIGDHVVLFGKVLP